MEYIKTVLVLIFIMTLFIAIAIVAFSKEEWLIGALASATFAATARITGRIYIHEKNSN